MIHVKKSLGIFGDSYASPTLHNLITKTKEQIGVIWPHVLDQEFQVHNYARPGNSIYKCYIDFIEFGNRHDHNVMIIPLRDRFYSSFLDDSEISRIFDFENWYSNYQNILFYKDNIKQRNPSNIDKHLKIFDSLEVYYEFWKDDEFLKTVNAALADKLKTFNNLTTVEVESSDTTIGLKDISDWEFEIIKLQSGNLKPYVKDIAEKKKFLRDNRNCHLTEENNVILGKIILDAVKNNKKIELKIKDFAQPTESASSYFEWIYI